MNKNIKNLTDSFVRIIITASMLLGIFATNVFAQTPELVKDLNPFSELPYFTSNRVVINDKIIFAANSNPEQGDELHTVNTTTGEYNLLKDIVPGSGTPSINTIVKSRKQSLLFCRYQWQ